MGCDRSIIQQDARLAELIEEAHAEADEKGLSKPNYAKVRDYLKIPEGAAVLKELAEYFKVSLESRDPKADPAKDVVKKFEKLGELRSIFVVQNTIPAGVELHSQMSLIPGYGDDNIMRMAFDAFVEVVLSRGHLGGMAAKGYGAVETEAKVRVGEVAKDFAEVSRAGEFWEWLKQNKKEIREMLENLDRYLFGGNGKKNKGGE